MSKLLKIDKEYTEWISELSLRFRKSQIKAAVKVNSEMLHFYWSGPLAEILLLKKLKVNGGMAFIRDLVRICKPYFLM